MQKRIILVIIVSLFILLIALSAYSIPQWASTHKHPGYSANLYFISVGTSSDSLDEAKEAARLDMAKQIRVQIKGELIVKQMSTQVGEEYYYRRDTRSRTESFVNEELAGVQIVETSEDNGIFYALAVLDRKKIGNKLKLDIEDGIESVNRLLTNANKLMRNGNFSGMLADLAQAHPISYDVVLKRSLYEIISPPSSLRISAEAKATPPMILSQIRDILSRLRLVRVSGDGQIGSIGKQLPEPMVVQLGIITEDGGMIPVEGMEVRFQFSPKDSIGKQITDDNGEASVMVAVRPPTGYQTDSEDIVATLTLGELPEELEGTLPVVYTVFYYGIEMDTYPVRLSILSEDGEKLPKLESKVKRALNKLGYTVEKDARISLEGNLVTTDVREMGGMRPQTLVMVELDLSVLDAEEEAVLDSASFSGKGIGRNEEQASQKGTTAVKINEGDLSSLLQVGKEVFVNARERRSEERFEDGEQLFNAGKYKAALRKLEGVAVGTEYYADAQKLVEQIMSRLPPVPRPSIAIFEPKYDGSRRQREIARTFRDMATTAFITERELRVVERERLEDIMKEMKLGLSGYVDQSQAAQVGRLAGADALLLSSLRTVGGDVELDARLIKTETGESLAAATSRKSYDELRAIAEDIANQIIDFLDETPLASVPERIVKPTTDSTGVSEPSASPDVEVPKVRVMVVIPEIHIRRRIPDPAGETEIIRKFLEKGFLVVDQAQVKNIRDTEVVKRALKDDIDAAVTLAMEFDADVIIIGEAFSEFAGSAPGMVSCRARLEARAIRADDGVILAADGRHAAGLDPVESLAAKTALKNAGALVADYFMEQIINKWGKEQIEGGTVVQVLIYKIEEYGNLVRFENVLKSAGFVQAIHRRSFTDTVARIDVELKGDAQKLADYLYSADQSSLKVRVKSFSTDKIEVEVGN